MAIIGGWLPGRILIVLYAYFDESGEHNPDGSLNRLTIGGFIAPWSEVEQLCIEWRAAQAEHAMGEFHMKEFASDEHDFWSWPPERQKRLNDFVHILCKRAERFCARTYKVTNGKKALKDTYETALAGIVPKLGTIAEERGKRSRCSLRIIQRSRASLSVGTST